MVDVKNAMEIFTVLEKSNCRECGEKTCLAFAGAVFCGIRRIQECPRLNKSTIEKFTSVSTLKIIQENDFDAHVDALKEQINDLDYSAVATRIGGKLNGDILQVMILGKLFGVKKSGGFVTDLHVNPWVIRPFLHYVLHCKGVALSGDWISFREIPGGKEKYALFKKRGEDVLLALADRYPDFFNEVVHMFDGREVPKQFAADISVVLQPLPLVPIMLCYWRADEGLVSNLNVFFDKSAGDNIGIDSAFSLGTGLAQMLEKLSLQHGF